MKSAGSVRAEVAEALSPGAGAVAGKKDQVAAVGEGKDRWRSKKRCCSRRCKEEAG